MTYISCRNLLDWTMDWALVRISSVFVSLSFSTWGRQWRIVSRYIRKPLFIQVYLSPRVCSGWGRSQTFCQKRRWQVTAKHPMYVAFHEVTWHGAWLHSVHKMHKTAATSRVTPKQCCKTPLGWIFKTCYEKWQSLIQNHMWQKHRKSAEERRTALYKNDHHFIFYCQDMLVFILFLTPQRGWGWYHHTVTAKWAFSLSVHAHSVYLTTQQRLNDNFVAACSQCLSWCWSYLLEETVDDTAVQHVNVLAVHTLQTNTQCTVSHHLKTKD